MSPFESAEVSQQQDKTQKIDLQKCLSEVSPFESAEVIYGEKMEAKIDWQREIMSELNGEMSKVDIKSADSQNEPDPLNNQEDDTTDSENKGTEMKNETEVTPNIQCTPKNICEWVAVVQEEGDEAIEIPTESDGAILISTLRAQFPGVIGLKFRNPETNTLRGIRCSDKQLYPPNQQADSALWGNLTYICTRAKAPARTPASKVVTE